MRPAVVRFYVDADVLGLARVLAALRSDVTFPGDPGAVVRKRQRPPCAVPSAHVPDTDWLPIVGAAGWVVITRDGNIRQHHAEVEAVRRHGVRMVALAGSEAVGTWEQLEVVMSQWRRIEALVDLPGPFIYTATRTALSKVM